MRLIITRSVVKELTSYSYFCDFFALTSAARLLSNALSVSVPSSNSSVEKSSAASYCLT